MGTALYVPQVSPIIILGIFATISIINILFFFVVFLFIVNRLFLDDLIQQRKLLRKITRNSLLGINDHINQSLNDMVQTALKRKFAVSIPVDFYSKKIIFSLLSISRILIIQVL